MRGLTASFQRGNWLHKHEMDIYLFTGDIWIFSPRQETEDLSLKSLMADQVQSQLVEKIFLILHLLLYTRNADDKKGARIQPFHLTPTLPYSKKVWEKSCTARLDLHSMARQTFACILRENGRCDGDRQLAKSKCCYADFMIYETLFTIQNLSVGAGRIIAIRYDTVRYIVRNTDDR